MWGQHVTPAAALLDPPWFSLVFTASGVPSKTHVLARQRFLLLRPPLLPPPLLLLLLLQVLVLVPVTVLILLS